MRKTNLVLTALTVLTLNSCALLFNGTKQDVSIKSMTPGAKIYVNGNLERTESVSLKLRRKDNHTIMVKKDLCKTETVQINSDLQVGWLIFDVFFNLPAILVDAPTGAWKSFDKTNITADLECEKSVN